MNHVDQNDADGILYIYTCTHFLMYFETPAPRFISFEGAYVCLRFVEEGQVLGW